MPKVDPNAVPISLGSTYPAPFDEPCKGRHTARLSRASANTQFGVNLVTLEPGAWSSQRHWHSREDEFVVTGSDEAVRVPGAIVTATLFPTLGVRPVIGRGFLPDEDRTGAPRVVLLSHGVWQSMFGSDSTIVGRSS